MKKLLIVLVAAFLLAACKKDIGARIDDNGVQLTAPQGGGVDPNGGH